MINVKDSKRLIILASLLVVLLTVLLVTNLKEKRHEPSVTTVTSSTIGPLPNRPNSTAIVGSEGLPEADIKTGTSVVQDKTKNGVLSFDELFQLDDIVKFNEAFFKSEQVAFSAIYKEEFSEWEDKESQNHLNKLDSSLYDLVVLPLQQRVPYYDRVGRIMSARWMAKEMESQAGLNVMSPELALRILGKRTRRFNIDSVLRLAQKADVNVVFLYLGDALNPTEKKNQKILVLEVNKEGHIVKKLIHELPEISLKSPLEEVIKYSSHAIVSELLGKDKNKAVTVKINDQTSIEKQTISLNLPVSFNLLPEKLSAPIDHAAYLQLFALMTPSVLRYERDRMFERSLMALTEVDPSTDGYNLLKARALFYLTRKPLAVVNLKDAITPAELALKAYLDGNYPELKRYVQEIDAPLLQLMGYIELKEIQYDYGIQDDLDNIFNDYGDQWKHLLTGISRDKDIWYAPDNLIFFSGIKGFYTEFDTFFEQQINAHVVSGEIDFYKHSGVVLEKVFQNRRRFSNKFNCCLKYGNRLGNGDLWRLYRNFAIANLLRGLNRSVNVHGSYDTAHDFATKIEPILKGHPTFTRLYAQASEGLASKKTGKEREFYIDKAIGLANKVMAYSGARDLDALNAELLKKNVIETVPGMRDKYSYSLHSFDVMDAPRSYIILAKRALSSGAANALPYDNANFSILKFTANSEKWSDEKLIEYLQHRYHGHPEQASFLADRMIASKQEGKAIKILKSVIDNDKSNWNAYRQLSELLIHKSEYEEAEKVFSGYTGFTNKVDENRVTISNRAYHAGNEFYWRGRHEEAKKYYMLAGSLKTGAGSGYASLQRLAMMEHDYNSALEYAFRRGKRYNDRYGYRDYLVMLHLLGAHTEAYSGFSSLVSRYDSPPIWTSLLVGQRIQHKEAKKQAEIIEEFFEITSPVSLKYQAARYLFLKMITDRVPSKQDLFDFPIVEQTFERLGIPAESLLKNIAVETDIAVYDSKCRKESVKCIEDNQIDYSKYGSQHSYNKYKDYLEAYIKFKAGAYEDAVHNYLENNINDSILKRDIDYDKNGNFTEKLSVNHTLPYLAMSAVKSNYSEFLQSLHDLIKDNQSNDNSAFDILLTESVIYAYSEDFDESLDKLKKAFNRRPHTKWRPMYSWYQITEIAEWLYHYSQDERYLNIALEWAKRYQVIQPQFSWAYAFEALYSDSREERIRATGFAQYLDRDSFWLSKVPDDIKILGGEWWKENNPFVIENSNQQNEQPPI